jgi:hypothetical protein
MAEDWSQIAVLTAIRDQSHADAALCQGGTPADLAGQEGRPMSNRVTKGRRRMAGPIEKTDHSVSNYF